MNLDRVTITGADNKTPIKDLVELTLEYPFVEWGILVSKTSEGGPRFPTWKWVEELLGEIPSAARLSLHVCGRWVRGILRGEMSPEDVDRVGFDRFQRVQLNFHAQPHSINWPHFRRLVTRRMLDKQLIFQMDGTGNETFWGLCARHDLNAVPLFDTSGGAGVVPKSWPRPLVPELYHGYAGGLGPDTLPTELQRIAAIAGDTRIWIDMEKRVRTATEVLDLERVRRVLAFCAPFVTHETTPS